MDSNNCCSYVAEKSDPSNWHGETSEDWVLEEDSWSCQHELLDHEDVEDPEFCVFHTDPDDLPDDVHEGEAFVDVVNGEVDSNDEEVVRKQTEFVGSTFGEFKLEEGTVLDSGKEFSVRFDHAIFQEQVTAKGVTFGNELSASAVKFANGASFIRCSLSGDVDFSCAEFTGDGNVSFSGAEFTGDGDVDFERAKFTGDGSVSFSGAEFTGDGEVWFSGAEFTGNGFVSFSGAEFTGNGFVSFSQARFTNELVLRMKQISDNTSFAGSKFIDCTIFTDSLSNIDFHEADFTGVNLNDVDFSGSNLEQAIFTRANLYDADFTGAKLDGTIFASARINQETNFGKGSKPRVSYDPEYGKVDNGIRTRLRRAIQLYLPIPTRWSDPSPTESNDTNEDTHPSTEDEDEETDDSSKESSSDEDEDSDVDRLRKAAGAYHTLERIGRENSLPDLQTTGFVRRQEMHHRRYREEGQWGKWLRAATARFTLLYGESPYRVAGFSMLIILISGALYPLGGFQANNTGEILRASSTGEWLTMLPDGIYFSTLTFTTLGFGDFQPVGMGKWLAVTETALGATMIALLVFVLGRRAAR